MTIQRRNRTRRLQLEPLEARDVPSVVSPHAGLLRPMARAVVHEAAYHNVHAARVRELASAASAGAASLGVPPAGGLPEPIIVVLGPPMPFLVTKDVQAVILYEGPAPPRS
jgi:hypothetical protein